MSSTSERSFGARLENARKLKTNLQSFLDYQPETGEYSIEDFNGTIQSIEAINPQVATAQINYRQSVSERRIVYATFLSQLKK